MSAIDPLCHLLGIKPSALTKEENILLEVELFAQVCEELKEEFKKKFKNYFQLNKEIAEKEKAMLDSKLASLIIEDILATKEYDLKGIAFYTGTHEEVIEEVIVGRNTNPSVEFFRRVIDLHRIVRRELYRSIMERISINLLPTTTT